MRRVSLLWMFTYNAPKLGLGVHDMFFNAVAGLFLRDTYHLSNLAIGFLANERSFAGSLLQPVFGAVSDRSRFRLGRRRPFIFLTFPVTVISLLLLAFQPPTWLAFLLFVLGPLALALAVVPYQSLLPDCVGEEQRGTASGIGVFLAMIGSVGVLLAAKALWEQHQALVFILISVSLGLGFLTLVAVSEPKAPQRTESSPPLRPFAYLRDVLSYREAAKYVVCYFLFWFGVGGITPFVTRFANEELGIPLPDTLMLMLALVLATLLFAWPAGWLGDRYGKKRVTSCGLLAFGLLTLVGSQVTSKELILPILLGVGVAQAVTSVLAYPLFTELVPAGRIGELTGVSSMIWSLAQPFGATTLGAAGDYTGTLRTVILGASIALLASFVVLQTVRTPASATRGGTSSAGALGTSLH